MERREFLKTTTASSLALTLSQASLFAEEGKTSFQGEYPKRPYGKNGEMLSIIGFGGIVVMNAEQPQANQAVAQAVEAGINYFDVAPSYGNAEQKLGPALEPFRQEVFLACKTQRRDRQGAEEELNQSLKNLRTDHFDLYQLHALSKMEDLEQALAPGGALETFAAAREQGKVRYLGFSAHSAEVALAAMDRFEFDSLLFPFNFVMWHEGDFGPQVLRKAQEKNVSRLALKSMAFTKWQEGEERPYAKCWYKPLTEEEKINRALRFTLSLDITAAIPPGEEELFRIAMRQMKDYTPLTEEEQAELKQLAQGVAPLFTKA
jgi:predicted aldo/keto reductase-like oxidoreductase